MAYSAGCKELPILGIVGVHVGDPLCGGQGEEWEAALLRINKALKLGERDRR